MTNFIQRIVSAIRPTGFKPLKTVIKEQRQLIASHEMTIGMYKKLLWESRHEVLKLKEQLAAR